MTSDHPAGLGDALGRALEDLAGEWPPRRVMPRGEAYTRPRLDSGRAGYRRAPRPPRAAGGTETRPAGASAPAGQSAAARAPLAPAGAWWLGTAAQRAAGRETGGQVQEAAGTAGRGAGGDDDGAREP